MTDRNLKKDLDIIVTMRKIKNNKANRNQAGLLLDNPNISICLQANSQSNMSFNNRIGSNFTMKIFILLRQLTTEM